PYAEHLEPLRGIGFDEKGIGHRQSPRSQLLGFAATTPKGASDWTPGCRWHMLSLCQKRRRPPNVMCESSGMDATRPCASPANLSFQYRKPSFAKNVSA